MLNFIKKYNIVRNLSYLFVDSRSFVKAISTYIRKLSPIDIRYPWFSYSAICFITRECEFRNVIEFGGGGSTLFLIDRGCLVYTLETSVEWRDIIRNNINPDSKQIWKCEICHCVDDVHADIYDMLIVDNSEEYYTRIEVIIKMNKYVKPGGVLILDDAYREQYRTAPDILHNWKRIICKGFGPCRIGVTQTDIYIKPLT